jgi:DNA-binding response OmpR family regulator
LQTFAQPARCPEATTMVGDREDLAMTLAMNLATRQVSKDENNTNVLLVEDEPLICDMVAEALKEQGFAVVAVANADAALQLVMAGRPIDILFTDVNLPGGMDGEALAQRVRELIPDLPVIYTSGRRSLIDQLSPVEGAVFVPKPYNPYEIGRLLHYLVATQAVGMMNAAQTRVVGQPSDQIKR